MRTRRNVGRAYRCHTYTMTARMGKVARDTRVSCQLMTNMMVTMPMRLRRSATETTSMSRNSWSWYTSFWALDMTDPTLFRLGNDMGSRWRWRNRSFLKL